MPLLGHFRELFERFIHRQIVTTVFKKYLLPTFILFLAGTAPVIAEVPGMDSLRTHKLKEVEVNGSGSKLTRASMPTQEISSKDFLRVNAASVSDAVKHFAGVTVKDYGGVGGLKTVSVRSLGAQHTAVAYDGVTLNDTQTGQIDLSRFSLDNVETISLSNGQPDDIFQPARMFASAGVISIVTKAPNFSNGKSIEGQGSLKFGSFGLLNPSISINKKISKRLAINFNSEYLFSLGNYPYTMYYGGSNDSTARKKRSHSDVHSFKNELNAYFQLQEREKLSIKLYNFDGERGLPGSTILYKEDNNARLWDQNFFTQLHYENKQSQVLQTQFSAKYSQFANQYEDININLPNGKQEDSYSQKEYYVSGSVLFRPKEYLSASFATDGSYNTMNNNFSDFAIPRRITILNVLASKYVIETLDISASLLHTYTHETVERGTASADRSRFSPTVSASWKPFEDKYLRLRAFYKDVFRVPTFNDLYYQRMGNPYLKPEKAKQFSVGVISTDKLFPFLKNMTFSTDIYYNAISDKIVALPKENLFVWSMTNMDKVRIYGTDVNFKCAAPINNDTEIRFSMGYTFQIAEDVTPGSKTYGEQLPYTPFHSGTSSVSVNTKWCEFGYSGCYSGKRWSRIENNIKSNFMNGYADHSVFISKKIDLKPCQLSLTGEVLNILDTQYDIVQYYPMPGRSLRITLSAHF